MSAELKKYNITTIIAIITFIGSLVGVWRAVEVKAVVLAKDQEALTQRVKLVEEAQREILNELNKISLINERTATILDQHIKYNTK